MQFGLGSRSEDSRKVPGIRQCLEEPTDALPHDL